MTEASGIRKRGQMFFRLVVFAGGRDCAGKRHSSQSAALSPWSQLLQVGWGVIQDDLENSQCFN